MSGVEHGGPTASTPMLRSVGELTIAVREISRLISGGMEPGTDAEVYKKWHMTALQGYEDAIRVLDALVDETFSGDGLRVVSRDGSTTVFDERTVSRLGQRIQRVSQVGRALGAVDALEESEPAS